MIELLVAGVWGYLLGSVPTGVLVSRGLRSTDVRQHGSSHTGGLNVSRVAGFGAGALTAIVDMLLGVAAVAGAALLTDHPWAGPVAGVMAIVGHNWSVLIGFGGGIGLSTLAGSLVPVSLPLTAAALVALALVWFGLIKLLHIHRARATILVMLGIGPLLWALGYSTPGIVMGVLGGAVVIIKTLPDWRRQYG